MSAFVLAVWPCVFVCGLVSWACTHELLWVSVSTAVGVAVMEESVRGVCPVELWGWLVGGG